MKSNVQAPCWRVDVVPVVAEALVDLVDAGLLLEEPPRRGHVDHGRLTVAAVAR